MPDTPSHPANVTGTSFTKWLAGRPVFGHPVTEQTALAMEEAWLAGREQAGIPPPTPADLRIRTGISQPPPEPIPVPLVRRSVPDRLRYFAEQLRSGTHWSFVSVALDAMAEELDAPGTGEH